MGDIVFNPRPYQTKAITEARNSIIKGNKKILIALGTGGGKSPIIRMLFEMALSKNPNAKLLYIVHRSILIKQMNKTLKGLNVDIMTLQKAGKNPTITYDLVLSDECHFGNGSKLFSNINYKYFVGLSATPITIDGYKLDGYDDVLDIAQLKDLVDWGFMPPLKVLSTGKIDTSKLKTQNGDFKNKDSYEMMSKSEIVKDLVDTYEKYAKGLKTIIYCVNIQHSEEVADAFIKAGYKCKAIHSKSDDKNTLEQFANNELEIVTNCDVLTTGLDLPDVYCLMLASPTKSWIKAIQIYGRIRLNPNDKDKEGLILDCSKTIENTLHPYQRISFDRVKTKTEKLCHCGGTLITIEKEIINIDDLSYNLKTIKQCNTCKNVIEDEQIKVINILQCKNCLQPIDRNISMQIKDKKIEFTYECGNCGELETVREVILTENELKEIEYNQIMQGQDTWQKIREILKDECKKWNYKWQWADRCIETLQAKNKSVDEVMGNIRELQNNNIKIGRLMYV